MDDSAGRMDGLQQELRSMGEALGAQIYGIATKLDELLRRHAS